MIRPEWTGPRKDGLQIKYLVHPSISGGRNTKGGRHQWYHVEAVAIGPRWELTVLNMNQGSAWQTVHECRGTEEECKRAGLDWFYRHFPEPI